jgi:hypothetical protein
MTKQDRWISSIILTLTLIFSGLSVYVVKYNTYMTEVDVPVTFMDRWTRQSCHKSHCSERYVGFFRTEQGITFTRDIGDYMYHRMRLGEKFELTLRPFDIRQNTSDNVWWFFGPPIVWGITLVLWLMSMGVLYDISSHYWSKYRGPQTNK